MLIEHHPGHLN
jgi:hypothetical protein